MGRHRRRDDDEQAPRQGRSGWRKAARAAGLMGKIALGQVISWLIQGWWGG